MSEAKSEIKDSGARQEFSTGAVRDAATGRGRLDLVPMMAVWLISRIYEDGAIKYAPNNWMKGIPVRNYVKSAMNHLTKYMEGMRDEPHLTMAGWNILGAIWTASMVKMGKFPAEFGILNYDVPPLSPHEEKSLETFMSKTEHPYLASALYVGQLPEERAQQVVAARTA